MRYRRYVVLVMLVGAGFTAGCAAPGASGADLSADFQRAWGAAAEVIGARMAVEERDVEGGRIVGATSAQQVTEPGPGVSGSLFGLQSVQTLRRRVTAHLRRTNGTCQLSVTAWVQRYDEGADTASDLGRDPDDLRHDAPADDLSRGPTWVDVRRDLPLEAEIVGAVKGRLSPG